MLCYSFEVPEFVWRYTFVSKISAGHCGSVGYASDRRLQVQPPPGLQHSFVKIDHEIFSTVILSLLLIQEGQLSVSFWRKNVHNTGYPLRGLGLSSKSVVR